MEEVREMRLWRWELRVVRRACARWKRDLHRGAAVVVALSLWMAAGGMTASQIKQPTDGGERFGEIHWYGDGNGN